MPSLVRFSSLVAALAVLICSNLQAQGIPKFERPESGLALDRMVETGAFYDVLGHRSAVFGYEDRPSEVWVYPLRLVSDFYLSFQIENYPLTVDGREAVSHINVRPEATTLTYRHAAFTVKQTMFAPIDEMGVVMLLEVDAVRPITIYGSFRPDLALMWPAGLMTPGVIWDAEAGTYTMVEETGRFVGIVGGPGIEDLSIQPYQEEPKDEPSVFKLDVTPEEGRTTLRQIVFVGSVTGREDAETTYRRLLDETPSLFAETAEYYRTLNEQTVYLDTPDDRLDLAFDWAKVGVDKGLATNPTLGTGFVAGFRTAGRSERPGFAWFFGRDALWTAFALTAYGDFERAKLALDFLANVQREDGKVPHEISQSASYIPWFEEYGYPWHSADATPLFIIAQADFYEQSGDLEYLRSHWPAIKKAFAWSATTDPDGNGLINNEGYGHGWLEGQVYPVYEEIYMQGLWIKASEDIAYLAEVFEEPALAREARGWAERTRNATEDTYWQEEAGFYAATTGKVEGADAAAYYNGSWVLPAVPFWWGTLDHDRAQLNLDEIAGAGIATDWGARILHDQNLHYDPLSYHNGSVWPLFTGWASMGAYSYGRPHAGYQALMATALLTWQDALGYVTELLSGDFNTAFGRSSHHQVWSEAMVITPAVRGLFGLSTSDGGRMLRIAPQLPANWPFARINSVPIGDALYDIHIEREAGTYTINVTRKSGEGRVELIEFAPAFPLDADVTGATINEVSAEIGRETAGDIQRFGITAEFPEANTTAVFAVDGGTDVHARAEFSDPGARSQQIRVVRSAVKNGVLELVVDGVAGQSYELVLTGSVTPVAGTELTEDGHLRVSFEAGEGYVRRTLRLPLK